MNSKFDFVLLEPSEVYSWLLNLDVRRSIRTLQVHHTWKPDYKNFTGNNHYVIARAMQDYHMKNRGFSDIAQNFTTFPDGSIMRCRKLEIIPAGIVGANAGSLCIENLGNFDIDGDIMTDAHKDSIVNLFASLCKRFNITPSLNTIVYHHWYDLATGKRTMGTGQTKSCPGTNFFGGNTAEDARDTFIPLIVKRMEQLINVNS